MSSLFRQFWRIVLLGAAVLVGVMSAMLLFSAVPPQTASPSSLTPTSAAADAQASDDCVGGWTTLENARQYAGFHLLEPTYLPDGLQFSAAGLNRMLPRHDFQVILHYRNLTSNSPEPYVTIDQRPVSPDPEPPRLDQKISPITIRGVRGELVEHVEPPSIPSPQGTPPPNITLTAFASGRITVVLQTPRPLLLCAWNVITTPIARTPTLSTNSSVRANTPTAKPMSWQPPPTLHWIENGVQVFVSGTYAPEELFKAAESLR